MFMAVRCCCAVRFGVLLSSKCSTRKTDPRPNKYSWINIALLIRCEERWKAIEEIACEFPTAPSKKQ